MSDAAETSSGPRPRSSPGTELRRLPPGRHRFTSRASLHDDRLGPAAQGILTSWRGRSTQRTQSLWPPPPPRCRTGTAPSSRPESRRPSDHSRASTPAPAHSPRATPIAPLTVPGWRLTQRGRASTTTITIRPAPRKAGSASSTPSALRPTAAPPHPSGVIQARRSRVRRLPRADTASTPPHAKKGRTTHRCARRSREPDRLSHPERTPLCVKSSAGLFRGALGRPSGAVASPRTLAPGLPRGRVWPSSRRRQGQRSGNAQTCPGHRGMGPDLTWRAGSGAGLLAALVVWWRGPGVARPKSRCLGCEPAALTPRLAEGVK